MQRPNILHLLTDQQRFDSIRALGFPFLQTPHLDRLCREGTTFTSAYTPAAECVPARASMITGMYADRIGCGSNADSMPPEAHPTLMSYLSASGYRTHGVGKCHFTPNPWAPRGFQSRDTSEEIANDPEGDDFLQFVEAEGFSHVLEPHGVRGEMYYIPQPSQLPARLHHSTWVADRSIDFIERERRSDQPWYLFAGFIHPHPPFAPPSPWHKLYRAPEMPMPYLPDNAAELLCFVNRFQNRYKYRDNGLDLNLVRCLRAYYFACVSFVDHQVGRILASLEATGELDNTLIVFTSDHGELLGDFGSFGKRSFHEASQRIPLIARLPGCFAPGERCEAPASLVDLLPTFLQAAGADLPPEIDGMDLAALAKGEARGSPVFFHYGSGDHAIFGGVDENWKYAWSAPDAREYGFDRTEFPERQNLAGSSPTPAGLKDLRQSVLNRAAGFPFSQGNVGNDQQWKVSSPSQMSADLDEGLLYQDPPKAKPTLPEPFRLDYPKENVLGY